MDLDIKKEENATGGRYVVVVDGIESELTFSKLGTSGNIIADHTGVPPALGGRGIASSLANYMFADARDAGFKIVPLCPFVKAHAKKHPEWSDVIMT